MSTDPISSQLVPLRLLQGEDLTQEKRNAAIDMQQAIKKMNGFFRTEADFNQTLAGLVYVRLPSSKTPRYYEFNPKETFK
jgi:hypothetical protein